MRTTQATLDAEATALADEESLSVGGGSGEGANDLSMDTAIRPPPPSKAASDTQPRWTANREAPRCELCKADFHLLNWRHHCRKCGRCVCSECSPQASWRPLPQFLGHEEPTRHCKLCVAPTQPMIGM